MHDATAIMAAQQNAYQESPGRQALTQLANLNKFLDCLNSAVKCLANLDPDHQALAIETMGRFFRLDKGRS